MKKLFFVLAFALLASFAARAQENYGEIPSVKYRDLKKMYNYAAYTPNLEDRYNPCVTGLASFVIPGLGQMMCGEWKRALVYFGADLVCTSYMWAAYYAESEDALLVGAIAALTVNILATVNATRMAKVKNMYEQDLRNQYRTSLSLQPSVGTMHLAGANVNTFGATLALRF